MTKSKYVYAFGGGTAEGRGEQKTLLGGKGANLAEMTNLGLPVPPGFTITTSVCVYHMKKRELPRDGLPDRLRSVLELMQIDMWNRAEKILKENTATITKARPSRRIR